MTPQLQQAIRLLQLSTLELQAEIQETLESNPLLEVDEGQDEMVADGSDAGDNTPDLPTEAAERPSEASGEAEAFDERARHDIPEDLPTDSAWDDFYDGGTSFSAPDPEAQQRDALDFQSNGAENLQDHLLEQLHLMPLSETDRLIASTIIESINENGYLDDSLENLHRSLAAELDQEADIGEEEMEAVLHLVQHLDPPGVGARDLSECLRLQLDNLPEDTPGLELTRRLVNDHLDALGARDLNGLKRKLKTDDESLQNAIALIQTLSPRPGADFKPADTQYVIPDVFVRRDNHGWRVELNPDIAPRLRINSLYAGMIKRADKSQDNTFLRNNLQEARWFIKSLQSRNETLFRVASAIVARQRAFFDYGEEAMKPLVLREIAEELDMHESTISRVTTQKYMHTPRGVFEFKYFFSSHVSTADGGECSATAIRAMIKKLVAEENPAKPLSDSKIASILDDRGIKVARRTIAKYREAMAIPPSNERKRLA